MIDLGDELAEYGKEPPSEPTNPEGMNSFGRLADLQAGGFNINRGRAAVIPRWSFAGPGKFTISAKSLPLTSPTWINRVAAIAGIPIDSDGFEPTGLISEDDPE